MSMVNNVKVSALAFNYARLIQKNMWDWKDVYKRYKLDTSICLVCWGLEDKVGEQEYVNKAISIIEEANKDE